GCGRFALGCGIVMVVLFLGCGGFFLTAEPKWRVHESKAGGFKVELPNAPRRDMAAQARVNAADGWKVEGTMFVARFEEYSVLYRDIPPDERKMTDGQLIDGVVAGFRGQLPGGQEERNDKVEVTARKWPGR